jgi:uncharacterized protein YraI
MRRILPQVIRFTGRSLRATAMGCALSIMAFLIAVTLPATPALASGAAVAVTDLNLRTGPSTRHQVVRVLRGGSPVRINACTQGPGWCDVTYRGSRGWVSARYLDFGRQTHFRTRDHRPPVVPRSGVVIGTPVITFQFGTSRGRHYYDYPRYDDRNYRRDYHRSRRHHGHRPRYNEPRYDYRSYNERDFFDERRPQRQTRRQETTVPLTRQREPLRSQPRESTPLLAEPQILERRDR